MVNKKIIRVINKSDKPDNIVIKESSITDKCIEIENKLPRFMKDYFIYIKSAVTVSSRYEYLKDVQFFCNYLVEQQQLTKAKEISQITLEEFSNITAIGDYCARYHKETDKGTVVINNNNKSLARRKSSMSGLFKFLYRNEQLNENITNAFNPIKLQKMQPDSIKKLEANEVALMLEAVENGDAMLTEKERLFWSKTKLRDKAILVLFVTYGLRISELRELNISSFNFSRGEFKIYRKRGKEVSMPINKTCEAVFMDYVNNERTPSDKISSEHKDALFLSIQNKRISEKAIRTLVKKYTAFGMNTERCNGYSPHKLRATTATLLNQDGFSIYDVQNLLDHDNVTTTQLYTAHKKNVKREIVKNFEWLDVKNENNEVQLSEV